MGNTFILKVKSVIGLQQTDNVDYYYSGGTYKENGMTYAFIDKSKSKAKKYTSYSGARNACHKINEKCDDCNFVVVEF
jgi:hypothetical protein